MAEKKKTAKKAVKKPSKAEVIAEQLVEAKDPSPKREAPPAPTDPAKPRFPGEAPHVIARRVRRA